MIGNRGQWPLYPTCDVIVPHYDAIGAGHTTPVERRTTVHTRCYIARNVVRRTGPSAEIRLPSSVVVCLGSVPGVRYEAEARNTSNRSISYWLYIAIFRM
jgi:hypothetical protein